MTLDIRFRQDFPGFTLDVQLALPGQGVSALFGPSGSGKSTLLRCIAGLNDAPQGRCVVNGEVWQDGAHSLLLMDEPMATLGGARVAFPWWSMSWPARAIRRWRCAACGWAAVRRRCWRG